MKNKLITQEWLAIFRNKKLLIPIIAVLFIPVLYSGMFLWAFWDPYEHLSDLPVAVVNEDSGASIDGKKLELGNDLAAKLKENKDFGFEFVSAQQGKKGLEQQKYYMLIKIPEDFSENATTLMDTHPKKLELVYMPNESFNFLSAQIGETAAEKIKASVSEKVSETYAETMFDKIGELANGLGLASDGATDLNDGAGQLKEGSKELYENLATLAGKSIEFNQGISTASSGTKELSDGAKSLADGMEQLVEGHGKLENASGDLLAGQQDLKTGASKLNNGLNEANGKIPSMIEGTAKMKQGSELLAGNMSTWSNGADQAASGAAELQAGIRELQKQMDALGPLLSAYPDKEEQLTKALQDLEAGSTRLAEGTKTLSGSADALAGGAHSLSNGLDELVQGQIQLQKGLGALAAGSEELEEGAGKLIAGQEQFHSSMELFGNKLGEAKAGSVKLYEGSSTLAGGLNQLAAGSSAMTDGTGRLASGAEKLSKANDKMAEGTSELAEKLKEGAEQAEINPGKQTYNMLAAPVNLDSEKINEVPNYGTGFAPYFLSLGLFVGALLLSIVFPLREPAGVPASGFNWFISKFGILAAIGILQAIVADAILLGGLGLHVESIPLFLIFSMVTSLTFIALIQFLVTLLGDPGRFAAIIILILQLTTSAGTFPLELIPGFLQKFNAYLPMTYSVQGFKAVISSGDLDFMWLNTGILGAYIVLLSFGSAFYFKWSYKRKFAVLSEN
ncbi:YhgE/Pip domain-containing protein [Mesobacillus subterraneus]|uniref:YhgE/Pip domain-containing protein n=1 Tax=Mesobacillus subterraneus TaxID=285983 RepID=A0A3R9E9Z0_9BACI|nr:YhgE/Pip domain-containing protein [Mesobacillus subterraneus]RSD29295.1 YhgE/Pip domain-containing protein [Mesobacillus subterraneus]